MSVPDLCGVIYECVSLCSLSAQQKSCETACLTWENRWRHLGGAYSGVEVDYSGRMYGGLADHYFLISC